MSITLIIIVITSILSIYAWSNPIIIDKWVFNSYKIYHKHEYWRLLTSGFIHSDYTHLIFNMLSLYFFGAFVESYYGSVFGSFEGKLFFVGLYILGILLSDIYSLFAYKDSLNFNSLGASGAVSAVVYASILLSPLDKIYLFFIPIGIPGFIYGFIYLLYSTYLAKQNYDNVNHWAHFAGAIVGLIFTILIYPPSIWLFIEQIGHWLN